MSFLEEVCRDCQSYSLPSVAVSLPMLGREGQDSETVDLSVQSAGREVPPSEMLCQVTQRLCVYVCMLRA